MKNKKCPIKRTCIDYKFGECNGCAISEEITRLHKKIDRLKKRIEKAEQLKSGEIAKKLIPYGQYGKGLFIIDNTLCTKTEYGDDSYIIWSGERFCGGVDNVAERQKLLILPIDDELVQMIERQYGERYKELKEGKNADKARK